MDIRNNQITKRIKEATVFWILKRDRFDEATAII